MSELHRNVPMMVIWWVEAVDEPSREYARPIGKAELI